MNIQIFGTRKCNDTKKAERVFQIRPSKFGGAFNQPNVPIINVVVDMVAPSAGLPR